MENQIAHCRLFGDHRWVVLVINQLLKADPLDRKAIKQRVEEAQTFAPAPELAHYVAALNRLLN